jgi:hypothetical protein
VLYRLIFGGAKLSIFSIPPTLSTKIRLKNR